MITKGQYSLITIIPSPKCTFIKYIRQYFAVELTMKTLSMSIDGGRGLKQCCQLSISFPVSSCLSVKISSHSMQHDINLSQGCYICWPQTQLINTVSAFLRMLETWSSRKYLSQPASQNSLNISQEASFEHTTPSMEINIHFNQFSEFRLFCFQKCCSMLCYR